jgi:hypothetical protein
MVHTTHRYAHRPRAHRHAAAFCGAHVPSVEDCSCSLFTPSRSRGVTATRQSAHAMPMPIAHSLHGHGDRNAFYSALSETTI